MEVLNGLSFDIEDWFQVENLRTVCPREQWNTLECRVEKNTARVLDLLRHHNQRATFFVLGWIAERHPNLVKKICSDGHELASHGYGHDLICQLGPEKFRSDIKKSKETLQKIANQEVLGYRAPNFSITEKTVWAIDILKEEGFSYDSSIFPTSFHNRYGFSGLKKRTVFRYQNGLWEIPLTVYPMGKLNWPLAGGAYFRLLPYSLFSSLLRRLNRTQGIVFYLHPWELDPGQPRMKVRSSYAFRHYANLRLTEKRLSLLLRDFRFVPLKQIYQKEAGVVVS